MRGDLSCWTWMSVAWKLSEPASIHDRKVERVVGIGKFPSEGVGAMKIHPDHPSPDMPSSQPIETPPDASPQVRRSAMHALSEISEEREARVQELQRAVACGTYHVPAEQLAEKILQEALREALS
jgi:hypothetical protein